MQNVRATIQRQFANSANLLGFLDRLNLALDQITNLEAFYAQVWNILTATGYGLDVWGRIVGVSRVLQVSTVAYFGFEEANSTTRTGWNQSPWYSGETTTSNFALADDAYLQLILAKAAYNITDGSIRSINSILMTLFGPLNPCWCTDNGGMVMTYTFTYALSPTNEAIVYQSGVLPRPAGVATSVVIVNPNVYGPGVLGSFVLGMHTLS